MDECRLTQEQIAALVAGERVKTEYATPGEYGWTDRVELELVPPSADTRGKEGDYAEDADRPGGQGSPARQD